jgi:uncharacterized membrane protein YphA (DoxX/SURF4 family)
MAIIQHRQQDATAFGTAAPDTRADAAAPDPARGAFLLLRGAFTVLPIAVGIDKFYDHFVDWTTYLWVGVPNTLHISAPTLMHTAGIVEIVAGLLVLFAPQIGGAIVTAWLTAIVANLVLVAHDSHEYSDIAIRDAGLAIGALALVFLATKYRPTLHRPG